MNPRLKVGSISCVLMRSSKLSAFAGVFSLLLMLGCSGKGDNTPASTPPTSVAVTGIAVPSTASVTVGSTVSLTATVSPSNATNKTLTWHSSDGTVASVSSAGIVMGVKAGIASITASSTDGSNITSNVCTATVSVDIPSAPTGLSAISGNQQVSLSWNASSGATSYRVKRGPNGGPYAQIATLTTTSYVNTGLTNGTPYYYVVSAVNNVGESANSSQVSATPAAVQVPPTVTAFAASGTTSPVTISTFTATDDVGVTGYLITESSTPPAAGSASWSASAPTSYATSSTGIVTLYPWAKDADSNVSAVYASPVTLTLTVLGRIASLEFGHTSGSKDYCNPVTLPSGFGNGVLFSMWTRIPQTLTAPASFTKLRGNMEVFYLDGSNWHLICLVGNIDGYPDGTALYNANFMLSTTPAGGKGDYCTYITLERDKMPLATVNDWVWVAWQVVVNTDHTMTLRQWLKFGLSGNVFAAGQWDITPPGEETVSIPGWVPSVPNSFQIGTDNTYSGINTGPNSYLCHARMEARTSKPTVQELEVLARLNAPDPTAWGDWELNWKDGAPNLSDRSGHGRNLSIQSDGALYQGVLGPAF